MQVAQLIRQRRKELGLTQAALAERIHVSAKAVSKWERAAGMPDAAIIPALSLALGVSADSLLCGRVETNPPDGGNMKRIKFYQCPDCGNILTAAGGGELHCCGRRLEPLKPRPADEAHAVTVQEVEEDWYITFDHPMQKDHFFRFAAYVTVDRCLLVRLYPEQGSEFRIPQIRGGGKLYLCCSRDGLFEVQK